VRTYVIISGIVFGLLTLVHLWRMILEPHLATEPSFILVTLASAALCFGACRVARRAPQG
jgi:hypothetical protein